MECWLFDLQFWFCLVTSLSWEVWIFGTMSLDIKQRENICILEPRYFENNKYFVYTKLELKKRLLHLKGKAIKCEH